MMLEKLLILIVSFYLLSFANGLNPFTQYELVNSMPISCIKYIPGVKILAVAMNTTGIDIYDIKGSNITFNRNIVTDTRVNSMMTAVNNSRLIFVEDYKVSYIDFSASNQTISGQLM